jgi:hypothetical protein
MSFKLEGKNMNKKIVVIFIISLFIITYFVPIKSQIIDDRIIINNDIIGLEFFLPPDQLDQFSEMTGDASGDPILCQSFTPSKDTISRIEIPLMRLFHTTGNIIISVRACIWAEDLVSTSISASSLPDHANGGELEWIEFDFPDININPESECYIVLICTNPNDYIQWGSGQPYNRGCPIAWEDRDDWWWQCYDCQDFAFRTYGYNNGETLGNPPIANANGPYHGYFGENITFYASGSYDTDGIITGYRWSWRWNWDDEIFLMWDTNWLTIDTFTTIVGFDWCPFLRLMVKDDSGLCSCASTNLTISENDPDKVFYISEINDGFQVSAFIINNGTSTVYNVTWSIDIYKDIGLILSGAYTEGVIYELPADDSITIQSKDLRGIGLIAITVQADDAVKQATAFLLGPLVLRVNEL